MPLAARPLIAPRVGRGLGGDVRRPAGDDLADRRGGRGRGDRGQQRRQGGLRVRGGGVAGGRRVRGALGTGQRGGQAGHDEQRHAGADRPDARPAAQAHVRADAGRPRSGGAGARRSPRAAKTGVDARLQGAARRQECRRARRPRPGSGGGRAADGVGRRAEVMARRSGKRVVAVTRHLSNDFDYPPVTSNRHEVLPRFSARCGRPPPARAERAATSARPSLTSRRSAVGHVGPGQERVRGGDRRRRDRRRPRREQPDDDVLRELAGAALPDLGDVGEVALRRTGATSAPCGRRARSRR